jgi:hypothetical protein
MPRPSRSTAAPWRATSATSGRSTPNTISTLGNLAVLLVRTDRPEAALEALRRIDLRLGNWLHAEVNTTRAAALRRQTLVRHSNDQSVGFSLAPHRRRDRALMAFLFLTGSRERSAMSVRLGHLDQRQPCAQPSDFIGAGKGTRNLSNISILFLLFGNVSLLCPFSELAINLQAATSDGLVGNDPRTVAYHACTVAGGVARRPKIEPLNAVATPLRLDQGSSDRHVAACVQAAY